jgi:hypothetical protein
MYSVAVLKIGFKTNNIPSSKSADSIAGTSAIEYMKLVAQANLANTRVSRNGPL